MGAIAHADLKPENILLTSDSPPTVKVVDFNAVILTGETLKDVRGAVNYMAPEMAHPETVDHFIDNYSIGVLAYELLTGDLPYVEKTPTLPTVEARIASRVPKNLKASLNRLGRSLEALDFIERLLEPKVGRRMSITEALEHPWLVDAGRLARSKGKQRVVYEFDEGDEGDDMDVCPPSPFKPPSVPGVKLVGGISGLSKLLQLIES